VKIFLALPLLFLLPAAGPGSEEAMRILDRAAARVQDGRAHVARFTQSYVPAGFTTEKRESGAVVFQAPDDVRFDYDTPEKKTFTYDGEEARFFSPADRQLTIRRLTEEEKAKLPIIFLVDRQALVRSFELSLQPAEDGETVVLLPRAKDSDLALVRLTFDARTFALRQIVTETATGDRTTILFSRFETEKARPAEEFRIAPPPGTRIQRN
jgi:outer membrane lipoprotein carrier protein